MSDSKSVSEELNELNADVEQAGLSDEDLEKVSGGGETIIRTTTETIITD